MKEKRLGLFGSLRTATKLIRAGWRAPSVSELDDWIERGGGRRSTSGMLVSKDTANSFTAFFSGVLQISQTIGSCPFHMHIREGKGKRIFSESELNERISWSANRYLDAYHWKETMQHHAIVWGNAYSWIQRSSNFQIIGLWILPPDRISVEIDERGEMFYVFRHPKEGKIVYRWDEIFHLAGFGFDGYQGYSLLSLHQDAIGLGLAQQEFQNRFLANGAHIPGFFEHPKELSEGAANRLKEDLAQAYAGLINTGKSPVLEEGMKYSPINMPLKDAEFLASRTFQIQEIARILNIPTPKLKDYSKLTYSNAEQLQIEYRTDTIRPWAERWESAINFQLVTSDERKKRGVFAEFDLAAIVRGDMKTEYASYREGRYGGWLNADEVRSKLGMNPLENEEIGQRYWQPVNMTDAADPVQSEADPTEFPEDPEDEPVIETEEQE